MAKEKFERTKPHVNVGTNGSIGPGESAIASVRLSVPSANKDVGPSCSFDGIAILSTNLPGGSTEATVASVERLEEAFTIDVVISDSRDVVLIPFNLAAEQGRRIHYLLEMLSNDTLSMDQCGLDVAVDVFAFGSGETVARHTPYFANYRPQFFFRTTGDTE